MFQAQGTEIVSVFSGRYQDIASIVLFCLPHHGIQVTVNIDLRLTLILCQIDTIVEQLLDCGQKERYSFPFASAVDSLKCVSSAVCIYADVIKPGACTGFSNRRWR